MEQGYGDFQVESRDERKKNNALSLFSLLVSVFTIHIILFVLLDTKIFPGFSFNLILFESAFIVIFLSLYLMKKEFFFKLSMFFSKKSILLILFFYILALSATMVNTIYSISKLEKDLVFKNSFPTTKLNYDYKNCLTLRNIIVAQSPIDYKLDNSLEKKLEILKQFNITIELHFTKKEDNKEFLIMVAHYPDFIYREPTKIFFSFILYLYLFTIYWLLSKYLQRDAKVKHTLGVFTLMFPIYFVFFAFSGAFQNGLSPIILKPDKSILEYLNDEYSETKMSKQVPLGLNNIFIKISSKDKK